MLAEDSAVVAAQGLTRFAFDAFPGYDPASQNPNGGAAVHVIGPMPGFVRAVLLRRAALVAEKLVLRQRLGVLQVSMKRPKLRRRDRIF